MLNIALVFTGDKYSRAYLPVMKSMLDRHVSVPFRLCVFTDRVMDVKQLLPDAELFDVRQFGLFGWWNKMILFNRGWHGLDGQILYYDIDMVLTGQQDLFTGYEGDLATASMFRFPERVGSTIMSIGAGKARHIWDTFTTTGIPGFRGDQEYIHDVLGGETDRWQTMEPGCVLSYKNDLLCVDRPPETCRAVSFHGRPDPHVLVDIPWVRRMWQ